MKKITLLTSLFLFTLMFSCKNEEETQPEETNLCNYTVDITYKWYNTYTTIDTYTDATLKTKTSTNTLYIVGFLKIEPNGNYEIVRNDVASVGTWKVDKETCNLILNDKVISAAAIKYLIINVTATELIIKKTVGNVVFTERYKTAKCPTNTELTAQWNNSRTFFFNYDVNANYFYAPYLAFPTGYFKLNANLSYDVLSNNVPLSGTWKLGEPYCTLDLDAGKSLARSFEVVKLTRDSLVIWRKDASASTAYLQYYLKN